ncbi:MAG: efflux RND transporter periplasmic adaptor subunit [Gammaproteobacteria bacterium]|nr:efflux RND transporter periplasmic adaptor subunit [Gammaproteobacteria bacterium]
MNTRMKILTSFTLVAALAASLEWWLSGNEQKERKADGVPPDGDVLYWYDPMRPEAHFDQPGRSPFMDMDLVPMRRDRGAGGAVTISPQVVQNLGVRTAATVQDEIAPEVTVTGTVVINERRLVTVTARAGGWVERLDARATGEPVQRGQPLAGLYSPDLLAAQEEYLLAITSDDAALVPAARRRLELLGMTAAQLDRIARHRAAERLVDLIAPANGVVTDLGVREGSFVTSDMAVLSIADLSDVWVIAAVPETQGDWLEPGQPATVTLAGMDGSSLAARVDYLYPDVTEETRTMRVRIVVRNDAGRLRPGMTARVMLRGESREALLVPSAALIRSGSSTTVVLAQGQGRFRPVTVVAGLEYGERTEIREGLQAGDQVVVSGQFLIDSEANLRGALDRLQPGEEP